MICSYLKIRRGDFKNNVSNEANVHEQCQTESPVDHRVWLIHSTEIALSKMDI